MELRTAPKQFKQLSNHSLLFARKSRPLLCKKTLNSTWPVYPVVIKAFSYLMLYNVPLPIKVTSAISKHADIIIKITIKVFNKARNLSCPYRLF